MGVAVCWFVPFVGLFIRRFVWRRYAYAALAALDLSMRECLARRLICFGSWLVYYAPLCIVSRSELDLLFAVRL